MRKVQSKQSKEKRLKLAAEKKANFNQSFKEDQLEKLMQLYVKYNFSIVILNHSIYVADLTKMTKYFG